VLLAAINNLSAALNSSTGLVLPAIEKLSVDLNNHANSMQALSSNARAELAQSATRLADTIVVVNQDVRTLHDSVTSISPVLSNASSNFDAAVRALTSIGNILFGISQMFSSEEFPLHLSGKIAHNFNQGISGYFSSLTRERTPSSEKERQSQAQLKNMIYLIKSAAGQIDDAMKEPKAFYRYADNGNTGK
jgi:hypothetical protein